MAIQFNCPSKETDGGRGRNVPRAIPSWPNSMRPADGYDSVRRGAWTGPAAHHQCPPARRRAAVTNWRGEARSTGTLAAAARTEQSSRGALTPATSSCSDLASLHCWLTYTTNQAPLRRVSVEHVDHEIRVDDGSGLAWTFDACRRIGGFRSLSRHACITLLTQPTLTTGMDSPAETSRGDDVLSSW
jgi:hypothetical protein